MMLTDPRISFGLRMIKGPILSRARFKVDCDNAEVKDFIQNMVTRFWQKSVAYALKAIEWGYSCSEATFIYRDGRVQFDGLKLLHPLDCRCITQDGHVIGARVRQRQGTGGNVSSKGRVYLPGYRMLWHVQQREEHPYYGRSRLYGAYMPWIETWDDGGFRDCRRLFFHKYAYDGGVIYHPPGETVLEDSQGGVALRRSNNEIARELMEKRRTGGTLHFPNEVDEYGQRKWQVEPPSIQPPPAHVVQYGRDLREEIWEGMGLPPEIGFAEGTGAYAGRRVPLEAFYSTLQENVYWLITDFKDQIADPLVKMNYGQHEFSINPMPLLPPDTQEAPSPSEEQQPDQPTQMGVYYDESTDEFFVRRNGHGRTPLEFTHGTSQSSMGAPSRNQARQASPVLRVQRSS